MIMKKFLLTIAAMVSLFAVSSGTAWAETAYLYYGSGAVTSSSSTYTWTGTSGTQAEGFTIVNTNSKKMENAGACSMKIESTTYTAIKIAKQSTYTINFPSNIQVNTITFYGILNTNTANSVGYFTTIGDFTGTSATTPITVLKTAEDRTPSSVTVTSAQFNSSGNNINSLGFKTDGAEMGLVIKIDYDTKVSLSLDKTVGYTTYYGDKALTIPSDVKVYTAQYSDPELKLSQITTGAIPANTAVIISGTPGATATFITTSETVAAITNNDLQGVATDTQKEDVYVLSYRTGLDDIGFYHATSRTIPAHKVYFEMPATEGKAAPVLRFNFGQTSETDNVSGIEAVTIEDREEQVIYDLRGRRVQDTSRPGLYIVGGKKVAIR
jgi:hypothetical protein